MDIDKIAHEAFDKDIYKKNIHYIFQRGANPAEFEYIKMAAASPGQSAWMIQQAHYIEGTQMQINKDVSDDLRATDFGASARVENVYWPSPVIEFYFEDPKLPTLLLMKTTPDQLRAWFPQLGVGLMGNEYITGLMQEGSTIEDGKFLSVQLKPDMYDKFLRTGESAKMETSFFSHDLTDTDNASMAYMVNLALKVLAFASTRVCKSTPIGKKQMHYGGKPDVQGRPARPSVRTEYLPQVVYQRPPNALASGRAIQFKGRRGHIHWYKSEVFVHRRGTWDFIQPVKNPITGKYPPRYTIKVRKPIDYPENS